MGQQINNVCRGYEVQEGKETRWDLLVWAEGRLSICRDDPEIQPSIHHFLKSTG